jgi:hypothetical protein
MNAPSTKLYCLVVESSLHKMTYEKSYKSRYAAEKRAAKLNISGGRDAKIVVMSYEDYAAAVKGKGEWKKNLMSGKPVWVAHDTPISCDPSSETYWSM